MGRNLPSLLIAPLTIATLVFASSSTCASSWVFDDIDPTTTTMQGGGMSLDLDNGGNPHIAFGVRHAGGGDPQCSFYLKYATKSGGAWSVSVVDSIGLQMARSCQIATDVDWGPHIAYAHMPGADCFGGPAQIRHARPGLPPSIAWIVQVVSASGFFEDIATDEDERIHIAHGDSPGAYAVKSGGSWTIESVPGGAHGLAAVTTRASGAKIHAAFMTTSGPPGDTWYAIRDASAWTVTSLGVPAADGDIAVSPTDQPHIALEVLNPASTSLLYATKPLLGVWSIESVDTVSASSASIAIDSDGNPHIGYVHQVPGPVRIMYARKSGGAWLFEIVDSDSILGGKLGFDLDAAGRPHFAYRRSTTVVRYARLDPASDVSPPVGDDPVWLTIVPNPARAGEVRVLYQAPIGSPVAFDIYDASGRKVRSLAEVSRGSSSGSAVWNGRDATGRLVAAGAYFVRMNVGAKESKLARVTLLR